MESLGQREVLWPREPWSAREHYREAGEEERWTQPAPILGTCRPCRHEIEQPGFECAIDHRRPQSIAAGSRPLFNDHQRGPNGSSERLEGGEIAGRTRAQPTKRLLRHARTTRPLGVAPAPAAGSRAEPAQEIGEPGVRCWHLVKEWQSLTLKSTTGDAPESADSGSHGRWPGRQFRGCGAAEVHPCGVRVGTGGRTCSCPTSPHAEQRTVNGSLSEPRPWRTSRRRSSTHQRSQCRQYACSSWSCARRPARVLRSITPPPCTRQRLRR